MKGFTLDIEWTEPGVVRVLHQGAPVVTANIGHRKGPTSATCLPTGVKFLTDTQEMRGKLTLETVKMDLSSVLETLQPPPAAAPPPKVAPRPRPRRRAAPKPAPPPPPPPDPGVLAATECVQTRSWEAYADGWRVRSINTGPLAPGERRNLALQLLAGQSLRIEVCGEEKVAVLEAQLVDAEGNRRVLDTGDRQLTLAHEARENAVQHVLITNLSTEAGAVAIAVLTR